MKVMLKNASLKAFSHICFIISFHFCKLKSFCTTQLKIKGWQFELQLKKLELEGKEMALKRQEVETCNLSISTQTNSQLCIKKFQAKIELQD
jgi:hypothetical protein